MTNAALLRRPDTAFRLGALALIIGPLLFFLTEFIAAAAWTTRPPDAPDVIVAASLPVNSAIRSPAAISSSSI